MAHIIPDHSLDTTTCLRAQYTTVGTGSTYDTRRYTGHTIASTQHTPITIMTQQCIIK